MAKILIIDDDGIVRDALSVFLARAGFEVATAADGISGLITFKSGKYDLVLLDRDMPGLSGSEVLAGIRAADLKTRVVILTGYDDPGDAGKYLRSGATSFLSKGDGLSNVLTEVERLLGSPAKKAAAPAYERQAPAGTPASSGGRILIADDDATLCSVLTRFLTSEGYAVTSVLDGGAALAAAETENPDIALLDIAMPVKDGVEVLKELTRTRPGTGVLMITGNDDEELARECLKNGAFDYLAKPVNLAALGTLIRTRLLVQKK